MAGMADPPVTGADLVGIEILAALDPNEREAFAACATRIRVAASAVVVHEGEAGREMYLVIRGTAAISRNRVDLQRLQSGDAFGELGLYSGRPRAATVTALSHLELARLDLAGWQSFTRDRPAAAVKVCEAIVATVGEDLVSITESMSLLLSERSLPRRTEIVVRVGGELRRVPMGTMAQQLLPETVDGSRVVAALVDRKAVSLDTRLVAVCALEPLLASQLEGREVALHSAGLLVLEAIACVAPAVVARVTRAPGEGPVVALAHVPGGGSAFADQVNAELARLIHADVPLRQELWTVEEAQHHFEEQGWTDAASLLKVWRTSHAMLATCGKVSALAPGPLLPSARLLAGLKVAPDPAGVRIVPPTHDEPPAIGPPCDGAAMVRDHAAWLEALGVQSVGAFNETCIGGKVGQLVRVAEGFHEKGIGRIADQVVAARPRIRVICVAGPSSSGKTTFIKRLTVQLQVNGLNPVGLSLDDYYVDRERTVKDEHGEYDFEAFEAIDAQLLQDHLKRLVAGETVKTAHYDFKAGKSHPDGGPAIQLGPDDLLLLEGIHGLNPQLLAAVVPRKVAYRVFIHPATTLPLDRLSPVTASDLRLLRRIVRDRHHRGHRAADSILRWLSVRRGERRHIFPFLPHADAVFDSSLVYEIGVLQVYADQYLLEVPPGDPAYTTAFRLRNLIDRYVTIYPDHVPPTSLLREFIGGSGFEY
jgi:uridine kinase